MHAHVSSLNSAAAKPRPSFSIGDASNELNSGILSAKAALEGTAYGASCHSVVSVALAVLWFQMGFRVLCVCSTARTAPSNER